MSNEITFIPHCDEDCGLGAAWFNCPECGARQYNCDTLWWDREVMDDGKELKCRCDCCKIKLTASKDRNGDYIIETALDG